MYEIKYSQCLRRLASFPFRRINKLHWMSFNLVLHWLVVVISLFIFYAIVSIVFCSHSHICICSYAYVFLWCIYITTYVVYLIKLQNYILIRRIQTLLLSGSRFFVFPFYILFYFYHTLLAFVLQLLQQASRGLVVCLFRFI